MSSDREIMHAMIQTLVPLHITPQATLAAPITAGDTTVTVTSPDELSTGIPFEVYDGVFDLIPTIAPDWDGSETVAFDWSGFATPGFTAPHDQGSVSGTNLYDRAEQPAADLLESGWPVLFITVQQSQSFWAAEPLMREPAYQAKLVYLRSLIQKRPLGGATQKMRPLTWAFLQEDLARSEMKRIETALMNNWFLEDEQGRQHSMGYGQKGSSMTSLSTIQWTPEVIDQDNAQFEARATIPIRGIWDRSEQE